jgi:hypothetical protein
VLHPSIAAETSRGSVTPNHTGGTTNPFLKILEELGDE